jgi:hypothetical protein
MREAIVEDADKTEEGTDRNLEHGDGGALGLPTVPQSRPSAKCRYCRTSSLHLPTADQATRRRADLNRSKS